jgi:hypothetical protein
VTIDGRWVELTVWQADMVRAILLAWHNGQQVTLPAAGRGAGKTTVLATVYKFEKAHARGRTYQADPRYVPPSAHPRTRAAP